MDKVFAIHEIANLTSQPSGDILEAGWTYMRDCISSSWYGARMPTCRSLGCAGCLTVLDLMNG